MAIVKKGNNRNTPDTSWKAQGFLNLYLPTTGGDKRKIGAIPLRESNEHENNLLEWLLKDIDGNTAKLLSKLIIEFRTAEAAEGSGLDLS